MASPPLVVAYALAGHMEFDLYKEPLGKSKDGKDIYLKDIWPTNKEIEDTLKDALNADMFVKRYSNISEGPKQWQEIKTENINFPSNEFKNLGYESYVFGQKSYNGVAFLSKVKIENIKMDFIKDDLKQSRIISGDIKINHKKIMELTIKNK